jgi:general secretion pathway protein F
MTTRAFSYRALSRSGEFVSGTTAGETEPQARAELSSRGLLILDLTSEDRQHARVIIIPIAELAQGFRLLAGFLRVGIPLARALSAFADVAPKHWSPVVPWLAAAVQEGKPLSGALSSGLLRIPPIVPGILRAGEASGELARAVDRAAAVLEASATFRASLAGLLAYPVILAIAGAVSFGFLVRVVLPRFADILATLGQDLPTSTRAILTITDAADRWALPVAIVAVICTASLIGWTQTARGRRRWHEFLLSVPWIGRLRRSIGASHLATTLGALIEAGVPLPSALATSAAAIGDTALEARTHDARALILKGTTLAKALEQARVVPVSTLRLVRAGEGSGELHQMLSHAGALERTRSEQLLRQAMRLVEPTLILGFGIVIGTVASAMLQAVYAVTPGSPP